MINMEFTGFDELMRAFNAAASEEEIQEVDSRIIDQAKEFVLKAMKSRVPQSSDNTKSGRGLKGKGESRPTHGHANLNIPVTKTKRLKGGATSTVGWKLEDNSEYFYMKFVNWGTLYTPPRDFINSTRNEAERQLERIAQSEYQKFLDRKLGD